MSADQFLRAVARRWRLGVSVLLLVLVGVSAYTFTRTPVYAASADIYVTIAAGTASESLYQESQFLLGKVASYSELATRPIVLEPVADALGYNGSVEGLGERVAAVTREQTSIITIEARSEEPQFAADLANTIATELGPAIAALEPEGDRTTTVNISVIRQAEVPENPVSPRVQLNLFLAFIAGLLVAVGAMLARDHLDKTIRTEADVSGATGVPMLGSIWVNAESARQPLVVLDRSSIVTEAFRTLRARLRFTEVDRPSRTILVTSAAPSEGKTTVAANLAMTLAQGDAKVCLVDADLRRPNIASTMGLDGTIGLTDVLVGGYPLDAALAAWGDGFLTVLMAGTLPPDPGELLGSNQMKLLIAELAEGYDYVIFDTPPLGPVADAAVLALNVDGAIVVSRHGKGNRVKLVKALQALKESNVRILGTVLNGVPLTRVDRRDGAYEEIRG